MKKYYVVRKGRVPGVYDNIEDVLDQVDGFPGADFEGFDSSVAATQNFRGSTFQERSELGTFLSKASSAALPKDGKPDYMTIPEVDLNAWAVDASCLGNPGTMEYRGVELMSGREIFRIGPFQKATNNIGEFLAIVHALALMEKSGEIHPIYTDSVTGMSWVKNKKIKTQLTEDDSNRKVFDMMRRALTWLNTHSFRVPVKKWQTSLWGEIPADFDRK